MSQHRKKQALAPAAPALKPGDIDPATGQRVVGQPTVPPPAPTGYQWMGSESAGGWVEGWVFVGNANATGKGPQADETAMQYAMRMGVPDSLLPSVQLGGFDEVNAWLAAQGPPNNGKVGGN